MTSPFDDRLRDELQRAIPSNPPADPTALADELFRRAAEVPGPPPPDTGGGGGGSRIGLWLAAVTFAGGALGGFLGVTGFGSSNTSGTLPLDSTAVFACPGGGEVGTLQRGDRVLIVGATADGSWLAVRNIRGALETVFIPADDVVPDEVVEGLPIRDCDSPIVVVAEATTSTTTTVVTDTTSATDSTVTSGTTPTTAPTGTTPAPDTTNPVVTQVAANPDPIWEQDTDSISCGANPRESTVSAQVADDRGIQSVTLSWEIPSGGSGSKPMSGSGTYTATFGPFPYLTVNDNGFESVTLTITATDTSGNVGVALTDVTLVSTATCFG